MQVSDASLTHHPKINKDGESVPQRDATGPLQSHRGGFGQRARQLAPQLLRTCTHPESEKESETPMSTQG